MLSTRHRLLSAALSRCRPMTLVTHSSSPLTRPFSSSSSSSSASSSSLTASRSSSSSSFRMLINGKQHVVDNPQPDMSLLEYLRSQGLTGSKLVCGEGGCGACSVMLSGMEQDASSSPSSASASASANKLAHKSVNSCLTPLLAARNKHVTTVEGVSESQNFARVQRAMMENFGSQCGFCTPGFVVGLYTGLKNNPHADPASLMHEISSTLCRCTGYRGISDAVKQLSEEFRAKPLEPLLAEANAEKALLADLNDNDNDKNNAKSEAATFAGERATWHVPSDMKQLLALKAKYPDARVVVGNSEVGVETRFMHKRYEHLIQPTQVAELMRIEQVDDGVSIGAAVGLNDVWTDLEQRLGRCTDGQGRPLQAIIDQLKWFSGPSIRNTACIGGNVMTASPISDLNPVFIAMGAKFVFQSAAKGERVVSARDFFKGYRQVDARPDEVLVSVWVPFAKPNEYVRSFKQARRREDDIAIVTSCMRVVIDPSSNVVKDATLAFGGMAPTPVAAPKTAKALIGRLWTSTNIDLAIKELTQEFKLPSDVPGGMPEFRTTVAASFLYKLFLEVRQATKGDVDPRELSAIRPIPPSRPHPVSKRIKVAREESEDMHPVGADALHQSSHLHTSGECVYTDDIPPFANELHGALIMSTRAHAKIKKIDVTRALAVPGVHGVYTAKDVPASNKIGAIVHDEELFATEEVRFVGQSIGIVVADNEHIAHQASRLVEVEYGDLPAVLTIEQAIEEQAFKEIYKNSIVRGHVDEAMATADYVVENTVRIGGQEHFYFEPHGTIAVPIDGAREMEVWASTQNCNETQVILSKVLGLDSAKVACHVRRLGGGFGGKETASVPYSCAAAVAAHHQKRPVRLILRRDEDFASSGKRHPFLGKYRVGFDKDGSVKAVDVAVFSNGGHSLDLSGAVMDRALFFSDGSYNVPNLRCRGFVCDTNLPSHTAFRGFGGPQGMLIAEGWIDEVAHALRMDVEQVRRKNLYSYHDKTHYGQEVQVHFDQLWEQCRKNADYDARRAAVAEFNETNRWKKRGLAMTPTKFGLSFTANMLNQGSCLVHIYQDGSVRVSHGGTEMGQGLHTKVVQIVAYELGIPVDKVYISETGTDKVANSSPTAASMGSDLYGMAAKNACMELIDRLGPVRAKLGRNATWEDVVTAAWLDRVNLSAYGFHKVPVDGYDFATGKGTPFHYFTTGVAFSEVEIDCLTGDHRVMASHLVMDVGDSINPMIDVGQIEGAFQQGVGWLTIEEMVWGDDKNAPWLPKGKMSTLGPGAYKLPSIDDIPGEFSLQLMKASENYPAVHRSRGVGEPPILLSASAVFAIRDAIKAARAEEGVASSYVPLDMPLTCERIRLACADRAILGKVAKDPANVQARGSW
eukprot:TRINITY_DN65790_c9_g1_i1.p1 TRINITY_DN65790_c9_g1~~TRINITY_DN65790_c9_g1_i1.p1  ORF type:complete len:1383 (+),score=788.36 TRINITY_DN65790_c9_g1_i1:28-4149(+)